MRTPAQTTSHLDDAGIGPSQYFHFHRSPMLARPEYRLMLSVLEDAVGCFERWKRFGSPPAPVTPEGLLDWFHSDDRSYLYSFQSICFHLDLDPDAILARLHEIEAAADAEPAAA